MIITGEDDFTHHKVVLLMREIEAQNRARKALTELEVTYKAVLDMYNSLLEKGINNKEVFNLKYNLELIYFNIKR